MNKAQIPLNELDTYIYIDVSNIRSACLKTLGFMIDFVKLLNYFQNKYSNLKEVRYYEGIAKGDAAKHKMFRTLSKKGYIVCPLERKSYVSADVEAQKVKCPQCKHIWTAEFVRERKVMKSNVDVYLASDMLVQVSTTNHPIHIILVSCDGDYAEAIKNMISLGPNATVSVLATPPAKNPMKNTVSVRLKQLYKDVPLHRYDLTNIDTIRRHIMQ
jgi:uncharacterized LabA/DUF88 family protein